MWWLTATCSTIELSTHRSSLIVWSLRPSVRKDRALLKSASFGLLRATRHCTYPLFVGWWHLGDLNTPFRDWKSRVLTFRRKCHMIKAVHQTPFTTAQPRFTQNHRYISMIRYRQPTLTIRVFRSTFLSKIKSILSTISRNALSSDCTISRFNPILCRLMCFNWVTGNK